MADSYGTTSGNAYKGRPLKRMKLEYNGTSVKFAVNPEDYTQSIPNRITVTQTKGGAWLDAWGSGIVEISIKGTTGVGGRGKNIDKGYQRWRELRAMFTQVFNAIKDGEEVKELIKLYNYTDNEYWYCYPSQSGIELYRSKSRPHMYQYSINLLGIREIGQPETSSGVIGNPNSSTATASTTGNSLSNTTAGTTTIKNGQANNVVITTGTKTRSKMLSAIKEECRKYASDMEPIIGGKDGLIVPAVAWGCAKSLDIQSSGTVSNVPGFTGSSLSYSANNGLLLAETVFTSQVTVETYNLYKNILKYSPMIMNAGFSNIGGVPTNKKILHAITQTDFHSSLYNLIVDYEKSSIINKTEANRIKVIMLGCMEVYQQLFVMKNQEDTIKTTLTISSLKRLRNNISSVITYLSLKDSIYINNRTDISQQLRKLDKIINQLITNVISYL